MVLLGSKCLSGMKGGIIEEDNARLTSRLELGSVMTRKGIKGVDDRLSGDGVLGDLEISVEAGGIQKA